MVMAQALKSPYMTPAEAAEYLRIEERTLNNMRWRGEGPHWRKHGGKVLYHINDLNCWSRHRDFGEGPCSSDTDEDHGKDDARS